ncbi:MAG: hypothetical protein ACKOZT_09215 [Cyanobium sp.]
MAHANPARTSHGIAAGPGDGCLGRTCLAWGADGELSAADACLVRARLVAADPSLEPWLTEAAEPQPAGLAS